MKRLIFLIVLSILTVNSFSQTQDFKLSKADYLQKSKNQKTVGWVLLAGGTTMAVVGVIVGNNSSLFDNNNSDFETGAFLLVGGLITDLVSIPFFISSSSNARKAATISVQIQKIYLPQNNMILTKAHPTITLKIGL
ncbi:MAG: hypothetical protein R3342_05555 [Lutibacter sp.]|uniref:hypothetical protein n=1 Tax=Lutibacter sp. TaxID=1925666 RepID=UPI00299E66EB|nr:hypothetical protein [Lutibacter sp.]MDX1828995.1 hypothetical protein [Lutibacter sp.]